MQIYMKRFWGEQIVANERVYYYVYNYSSNLHNLLKVQSSEGQLELHSMHDNNQYLA